MKFWWVHHIADKIKILTQLVVRANFSHLFKLCNSLMLMGRCLSIKDRLLLKGTLNMHKTHQRWIYQLAKTLKFPTRTFSNLRQPPMPCPARQPSEIPIRTSDSTRRWTSGAFSRDSRTSKMRRKEKQRKINTRWSSKKSWICSLSKGKKWTKERRTKISWLNWWTEKW